MKIGLITDSACNLPKEETVRYDINVLPLQISTSTNTYRDNGIDLQTNDIYALIKKEVPKTSMPAIGDAMETLERLKNEGCTHVLAIHISKGLSATFDMVNGLKDNAKELGMEMEAIDSNSISMGLGSLVLTAAAMRDKGYEFSAIVDKIKDLKKETEVFFVVNTLEYLRKGGRIGKIEGSLGDLLNVKPIISINDEGVYYTVEKVRGRKKSLKAIADVAKKSIENKDVHLSILHGNAIDEAKEIYEDFKKDYPDVVLYDITSALGVHVGPGLIGITYSKRENL